MVGLYAVSHLARRGMDAVAASPDQIKIEQLRKAIESYQDTPEVKFVEVVPILITGLVFVFLFISVR